MQFVRALLYFIAIFAGSVSAMANTPRVALVMGNSAYVNFSRLPNPLNDARLIAATLRQLGFDVIEIPDATKEQMEAGLDQLLAKVTAAEAIDTKENNTIALIYYAGHGVQIDGVNFLIPVDADIRDQREAKRKGVKAQDLLDTIEDAKADVGIVILDACRNNPLPAVARASTRGLAPIAEVPGTVIAFATRAGDVAADGEDGNSPYAKALASNLVKPLSLEGMFREVTRQVLAETSGKQQPRTEYGLAQEVFLAGETGKEDEPGKKPTVVENAAAADLALAKKRDTVEAYSEILRKHPGTREELEARQRIEMLNDEDDWTAAQRKNTKGAYRIYIGRHPNGIYATEALRLIEQLEQASKSDPVVVPKIIDIQPPPPPKVVVPRANFRAYQGYDAYGFDYQTLKGVSIDTCVGRCQTDGRCRALTYNASRQWCFLKSGANLLIQNSSATAVVAEDIRTTVASLSVDEKTDYPGYDYKYYERATFEQCFTACELDNVCRAFTFVRGAKQNCWLKSDVGAPVSNKKATSGRK